MKGTRNTLKKNRGWTALTLGWGTNINSTWPLPCSATSPLACSRCLPFPHTTHTDSVAGVMVSIVAFQAVDPGSIPGPRNVLFTKDERKKKKKNDIAEI